MSGNVKGPNTGDHTNIAVYAAGMGLMSLLILLMLLKRRREDEEEEIYAETE